MNYINGSSKEYSTLPFGVNYEGETVDKLLEKANLDWKVKTTDSLLYSVNDNLIEDKTQQMIYREDKPSINFGTAKNFKPVQNSDIIQGLIDFSEETKFPLVKVGSVKNGSRVFGIIDINQECIVDKKSAKGEDRVNGYLLLENSHTRGFGMNAYCLFWRLICTNGMTRKVRDNQVKRTHSSNISASDIMKSLSSSLNIFQDIDSKSKQMAECFIEKDTAYAYVIKNFGECEKMNWDNPSETDLSEQPKKVSEILSLYFGAGKGSELITSFSTTWGLYNAITEQNQHHAKQSKNVDTRINSLLFGSQASIAQKTFNNLYELTTDINRDYRTSSANTVVVGV